MKVAIKKFSVEMDVRNSGIEFEVRDTKDVFKGDLVVTKSGLTWCEGKQQVKNGTKVSWDDFIDWMNSAR